MDGVGLPVRLLAADEREVVHLRTHAKALVLPALGLVVAAGVTGAGAALVPRDYRPVGQLVVAGAGAGLVLWWAVLPFLRWLTTTYTVTTRRLILRQGIVNKTGRDLPLIRVSAVSCQRNLPDRLLGCGTLRITTSAEAAAIELRDVPDVQEVQLAMAELLFGAGEDRR